MGDFRISTFVLVVTCNASSVELRVRPCASVPQRRTMTTSPDLALQAVHGTPAAFSTV